MLFACCLCFLLAGLHPPQSFHTCILCSFQELHPFLTQCWRARGHYGPSLYDLETFGKENLFYFWKRRKHFKTFHWVEVMFMLLLPRRQWVFINQKWEHYPVEAISCYKERTWVYWWSFVRVSETASVLHSLPSQLSPSFPQTYYSSHPSKQNSLLPLQSITALLLSCILYPLWLATAPSLNTHDLVASLSYWLNLLSTQHADIPWCFATSGPLTCLAKYHWMPLSFLVFWKNTNSSPNICLKSILSLQAIPSEENPSSRERLEKLLQFSFSREQKKTEWLSCSHRQHTGTRLLDVRSC